MVVTEVAARKDQVRQPLWIEWTVVDLMSKIFGGESVTRTEAKSKRGRLSTKGHASLSWESRRLPDDNLRIGRSPSPMTRPDRQ